MKNKLQVLIPTDCIMVCSSTEKIKYKDHNYSSFLGFITDVISDVVHEEGICNFNSVEFDRIDIDDNSYYKINFTIELLKSYPIKMGDYEYKRVSWRNKIQQEIINILTNLK